MKPASEKLQPPSLPWPRRLGLGLCSLAVHSLSWTLRLVFFLLILLTVLFAYLHIVGLPAALTDRLLDRLAGQGLFLQVKRVTLEIDRGLVATSVRLFSSATAPSPVLEAQELTAAISPLDLWRHHQLVPVFSIAEGSLQARLGEGRIGARQGWRNLSLEHINLRCSVSEREILLREFAADFLQIHFTGRGGFYRSAQAPRPQADSTARPQPIGEAFQALEEAPEWLLRTVEELNAIQFNESPSAEFTFALYQDHPEANTASFRLLNPNGGQIQHVAFDQAGAEVIWENRQLQVPDLQIQAGNQALRISGSYTVSNQMAYAHLINTFSPDNFLALIDSPLRSQINQILPDDQFPLKLELEIGPAPLAQAAEQVAGRITFSDATIKDVPIEYLDLRIARQGKRIRFGDATLRLSTGPQASHLDISGGSFDLDSKRFNLHAAGSINPHTIRPVLSPNQQNIVDWFEFGTPIEGDVQIGGTVGNPAIYRFGPVEAQSFRIQGILVDHLTAQLNITNEVMHMTGTTLTRPEGMARGDVHMAFSNQTLRLDVSSTLDPRATSQMIGPAVADFMKPFILDGPTRIQVKGLLDYCNFSMNRLEAHVEAQQFGYTQWVADQSAFDLFVTGRRLRFTNISATAYGGNFTGNANLYPVGNDATWRYETDIETRNVVLEDLLEATLQQPVKELHGLLDGTARIQGYIGIGTGPRVTGQGQASVRKGFLFQTKLFGGLSSVLSKIIPDFSLFAQTDATGSYVIRNSKVHSDDIELKGTVFSVKASGDYAFDTTLDYRVEVQLLRGGPVAAVLRLATLPVTRLLEFHLTGTFKDPRWRPLNLNPADLFKDKDP